MCVSMSFYTSFSRNDGRIMSMNDLDWLKSLLGFSIKTILTLLQTAGVYSEAGLVLINLQIISVMMVQLCCKKCRDYLIWPCCFGGFVCIYDPQYFCMVHNRYGDCPVVRWSPLFGLWKMSCSMVFVISFELETRVWRIISIVSLPVSVYFSLVPFKFPAGFIGLDEGERLAWWIPPPSKIPSKTLS